MLRPTKSEQMLIIICFEIALFVKANLQMTIWHLNVPSLQADVQSSEKLKQAIKAIPSKSHTSVSPP